MSDSTYNSLGALLGVIGSGMFLYRAGRSLAQGRRILNTPEFDPDVHTASDSTYVCFRGAASAPTNAGAFASVWEGEVARMLAVRHESTAVRVSSSLRDSLWSTAPEERHGHAKVARTILLEDERGTRVRLAYVPGPPREQFDEDVLWVEGVPMKKEESPSLGSRTSINQKAAMQERYGLPVGEWFTAYGQLFLEETTDTAEEEDGDSGVTWSHAIGSGKAGPLLVTFSSKKEFADEFWWSGVRLGAAGVALGLISAWLLYRQVDHASE